MYSGASLSYTTLLDQVAAGNTVTLARYAALLGEAGLLLALGKHSDKAERQRGSVPKFQTCDMALFSGLKRRTFDYVQGDVLSWEQVVASAVGAHLATSLDGDPALRLRYWKKGNIQVDFVVDGGTQPLAIALDNAGSGRAATALAAFQRAFPESETLLLGASGLDWREFLSRPLADFLTKD
jgi:predicted AAA+ superfamily ATPase